MSFFDSDWIFRKSFAYRGYAYILPFGLMAIITYAEWEQDIILWPLGFAILIPGILIRLWATKHIGRRMSWIKKDKKLVKTGPYAMARNPLYVGNLMIVVGLSIFSELAWFLPLVFSYFFILYHLVILHEERKLSERWGEEYSAYLKAVPRWIPKIKHVPDFAEGDFKWIQALRSELPSYYLIFFSVLVFVAKEVLSDMK